MKLKQSFKSRWAWTTAIIFILLGLFKSFSVLFLVKSTLGQGFLTDIFVLGVLDGIIPVILLGLIVNFIYGFILGLGLEKLFKG